MAVIMDIADAVVTELNGAPEGTFREAFTAQRLYQPVFDLAEMKTLHVTVVPNAVDLQAAGRDLMQEDHAIDVAIQKKLDSGDNAEIDALMDLVQDVADFFKLRRLTAYPAAVWSKTENKPVFYPNHIEQMRQFTSVLTITFRVIR